MPNTIALKGGFIRKELEAAAAITPGHMVEITSAGLCQVQSGLALAAQRAFALENDLVGKGIDDAYAVSETVQFGVCERGAEVYAWLDGNQSVAIGTKLGPGGDGSLVELGSLEEGAVCAIALETVDNSAGSSAGADHMRITVEVV